MPFFRSWERTRLKQTTRVLATRGKEVTNGGSDEWWKRYTQKTRKRMAMVKTIIQLVGNVPFAVRSPKNASHFLDLPSVKPSPMHASSYGITAVKNWLQPRRYLFLLHNHMLIMIMRRRSLLTSPCPSLIDRRAPQQIPLFAAQSHVDNDDEEKIAFNFTVSIVNR